MARTVPLSIMPSDYEFPGDTQARARLSQMGDLKEFSKDFISRVVEPWLSGELSGDAVRVTPSQLPSLHDMVVEVAGLMSVATPHVYIKQDPFLNAYTHGVGNQAFLVITHSLLEQLASNELRFVIAHEIGHIKSQHVLYTTMASYLLDEASHGPDRDASSLLLHLLEWQREAEVTADRAGLLVCGDIGAACVALLTLVVGSRKLAAQMDVREFIENQELAIAFNPIARTIEMGRSHPFVPKRLKELLAFASSERYRQLLDEGVTLGEAQEDGAQMEIELSN